MPPMSSPRRGPTIARRSGIRSRSRSRRVGLAGTRAVDAGPLMLDPTYPNRAGAGEDSRAMRRPSSRPCAPSSAPVPRRRLARALGERRRPPHDRERGRVVAGSSWCAARPSRRSRRAPSASKQADEAGEVDLLPRRVEDVARPRGRERDAEGLGQARSRSTTLMGRPLCSETALHVSTAALMEAERPLADGADQVLGARLAAAGGLVPAVPEQVADGGAHGLVCARAAPRARRPRGGRGRRRSWRPRRAARGRWW